jgi:hypothetical protein
MNNRLLTGVLLAFLLIAGVLLVLQTQSLAQTQTSLQEVSTAATAQFEAAALAATAAADSLSAQATQAAVTQSEALAAAALVAQEALGAAVADAEAVAATAQSVALAAASDEAATVQAGALGEQADAAATVQVAALAEQADVAATAQGVALVEQADIAATAQSIALAEEADIAATAQSIALAEQADIAATAQAEAGNALLDARATTTALNDELSAVQATLTVLEADSGASGVGVLEPTLEPAAANGDIPDNWLRFEGNGVAMWLPFEYRGGLVSDEFLEEIIDFLGDDFDALAGIVRNDPDILRFFAYDPNSFSNGALDSVNVVASEMPIRFSVEELMDALEFSYPRGYEVVDADIIEMAGFDEVGRVLLEVDSFGIEQSAVQYLFIDDQMLYVLSYISSPRRFDDVLPLFEQSAASFELVASK